MDANEAKAALKKFLDSNPEEYAEAYRFGKWWAVLKPVHAGLLDTLKEDVDLIEASLLASNLPPNWKSSKWDILHSTMAKTVADLSGLGVPKEIRP